MSKRNKRIKSKMQKFKQPATKHPIRLDWRWKFNENENDTVFVNCKRTNERIRPSIKYSDVQRREISVLVVTKTNIKLLWDSLLLVNFFFRNFWWAWRALILNNLLSTSNYISHGRTLLFYLVRIYFVYI